VTVQEASSGANSAFWNELCGTKHARRIGVTDSSPASLRRFDNWYFGYYPYLEKYIPFAQLAGKRVLEVGLGYGSVAQRLAESGAVYQGLDISPGPVAMVNHRLRQAGLPGSARQGDVLDCPFEDASFDHVVAIGCFHHTGNLQRAIAEAHRVLRPGGGATIMVYGAYSYRRWLRSPVATLSYFLWDRYGIGGVRRASARERAAYDVDSSGAAAPETVFVSPSHIRRMASDWASVDVSLENIGGDVFLWMLPRNLLLHMFGSWAGLDLYCRMVK
jgi:SAM-dependent methyltransferase